MCHEFGDKRYFVTAPSFSFPCAFPKVLATLFGISYIAPEDVVQSPMLLKG